MKRLALAVAVLAIATVAVAAASSETKDTGAPTPMELGNFSVSLTVKDIKTSRAFYEKLGFKSIGGNEAQRWLILRNGPAIVGLFQGMFEKNIMTFNPGWTTDGTPLAAFEDVRDLQKRLETSGITLTTKADPASTGPASFTLSDPDGNMILVDQHVPKPTK